MKKAFIFDLDGTLVDSEPIYIQAYMEAMAEKGVNLGYDQAFKIIHGRAWRSIYETTMERWPESWPVEQEAWDFVENHAIELCNRTNIAIAGSVELLLRLEKDYPVCVVSGSPRSKIKRNLTEIGVIDHVDFFMGSEDYTEGKPSPEPFLNAAKKWGVAPEDCVVFEDSPAGIKSAVSAGMEVVVIGDKESFKDLPENTEIFQNLADYVPQPLSHA